eukprot:TRINITY_DN2153_c0_g1_i1.p1 TRINITY_DN2153_c0_g1~~TRINITY_DN2153_c0_g1_i1.p1  ORF type:complete len:505 (-),score=73.43 TRINITY_DN2153_c0_g1_i1:23-1537(-)
MQEARRKKSLRSALASFAIVLFLALGTAHALVELYIDDSRLGGEIAPEYGSFNFDWWPNNASNPSWINAGLFNIDLSSPRLRYLARQLTPAHLRIGGTLGDTIVYKIPNKTHVPCVEGRTCLNMTRWGEIVDFARAVGVRVAFGLNERYSKGLPGTWDPSNARDFLTYIRDNKQDDIIFGFELGNELDLQITGPVFPGGVCARDFHTLRGILNDLWPNADTRPKLIGPDCVPKEPFVTDFLVGAGSIIDVLTWHLYISAGADPELPAKLMEPKWLDRSRTEIAPWHGYRNKYAPQAQLWLGETGPAYNSGQNLTTNRFEDGFWFINQLGVGSVLEHFVQCRQVLVGGNYALLGSNTFVPNPDYWTYLMFKRVVGTRALLLKGGFPDLISYGYCARRYPATGGVALTFGNLNATKNYTVALKLPEGSKGSVVPRVEYHLSAPGGLHSSLVYLNAKRPLVLDSNGLLPELTGQSVTDPKQPIVVEPHTLVFVEFPNAQLHLCQTTK